VPTYLAAVAATAADGLGAVEAEAEAIGPETAMGETMLLGLRLVGEGVPHARFLRRHGADPRTAFGAELEALEAAGLVAVDAERTRATPRGLALLDRVAERFIAPVR
jgi:oxygen-independent coproporphyrinogen-3 oxidase